LVLEDDDDDGGDVEHANHGDGAEKPAATISKVGKSIAALATPKAAAGAHVGGAFGFVICELAKIIVKAVYTAAIEACPECRLANCLTSGEREFFIIIRRAADHVRVGFDVFHRGGKSEVWPGCAGGTLGGGVGDRFAGGIRERLKNFAGAIGMIFQQDGQRVFERFEAKVGWALMPVEAIEKRCEFDQRVSRFDELQVQEFGLSRHGVCLFGERDRIGFFL
jgi:hypothetical protein